MSRVGRVGLAAAGGLAVLGLVLVAASGTARWVTAAPAVPELPGAARVPLTGSTLVPAAVPLALMGVAGLLAAAAAGRMARGLLRGLASILVMIAGAGIAWLALRGVTDPAAAFRTLDGPRQASATVAVEKSAVGYATVAGGLAILAAGASALFAGKSWPGLAARYERDPAEPANRSAAPATTWDALERGDDPTR
jgi:uncharacterized membrane protein (TIGR02234 family)